MCKKNSFFLNQIIKWSISEFTQTERRTKINQSIKQLIKQSTNQYQTGECLKIKGAMTFYQDAFVYSM